MGIFENILGDLKHFGILNIDWLNQKDKYLSSILILGEEYCHHHRD